MTRGPSIYKQQRNFGDYTGQKDFGEKWRVQASLQEDIHVAPDLGGLDCHSRKLHRFPVSDHFLLYVSCVRFGAGCRNGRSSLRRSLHFPGFALLLQIQCNGPFQIILKFITGLITDRISFISELNKCRLFNSLAFYGGAISFLLVTFLKPQNKLLCAFVTMIPQAMIGFNPGGFNKSAIVVPAQFSPTVLAVIQVVLCFSLFLGSFVVPFLTPTGSFEEYSTVFVIYAVILVVSNTFFVIFCSVEPAEWTKENGGKKKGKILEWTSQGQNSSRNTDIQNAQ
ncbi:hypothetical protein L596_014436 [Steinernema carpocapsae]|uniref:Major facilitator superfamily (MFS) profile domain-containing protein n=1 Tax=Steinernema carpocapsae TaxID=34508 RepID=A0A4U5ND03_STECR|nr:hypothetical protein L596_014436 [Steinernema carpocapsae]